MFAARTIRQPKTEKKGQAFSAAHLRTAKTWMVPSREHWNWSGKGLLSMVLLVWRLRCYFLNEPCFQPWFPAVANQNNSSWKRWILISACTRALTSSHTWTVELLTSCIASRSLFAAHCPPLADLHPSDKVDPQKVQRECAAGSQSSEHTTQLPTESHPFHIPYRLNRIVLYSCNTPPPQLFVIFCMATKLVCVVCTYRLDQRTNTACLWLCVYSVPYVSS